MEEARALLVDSPAFQESLTRPGLWGGLEQYVARFIEIEEQEADVLGGAPVVHFLWLGGSFVSGKVDPRNIDATVAIDVRADQKLKGRPSRRWLIDAFQRDKVLADFNVSALELRYLPVASVFKSNQLPSEEQTYLRQRGAWDDWWQRRRDPGLASPAPSEQTAHPVRGYLEVTL